MTKTNLYLCFVIFSVGIFLGGMSLGIAILELENKEIYKKWLVCSQPDIEKDTKI